MSTMMWTDLPTHTHTHPDIPYTCTWVHKQIKTHQHTFIHICNACKQSHCTPIQSTHIHILAHSHPHHNEYNHVSHTDTPILHTCTPILHTCTHTLHTWRYELHAFTLPTKSNDNASPHTHKLHCKLTSKQAQEPCICEQPTQWILQCKEDQQHTYEPDNHSQ